MKKLTPMRSEGKLATNNASSKPTIVPPLNMSQVVVPGLT